MRAYRASFKAWSNSVNDSGNKARNDGHKTDEKLRTRAISDQTAWKKHSNLFAEWKARNPAVAQINNVHEEMDALRTAEKLGADRAELVDKLRGKSEAVKRAELQRYDDFVALMKQSRDREVWRRRVEVQKAVEAAMQAEMQAAFVDEIDAFDKAEEQPRNEADTAEKATPGSYAEAAESANVGEDATNSLASHEQVRQTTSEGPINWLESFNPDSAENFVS